MKLGNLCDVVRGSSPRPKEDPRFYGGSVPRLMVADLTRDGKLVTPRIDSLTEEGAKQSRPMKKGDVVIAVSGNPGLAAILQSDACIHDGFVGLRDLDTKQISTDYLYSFLVHFKNQINSQAVGAIYKNLTTEQIRNIEIPLPPLGEQKRIAALLDKADEVRAKRRAALEKLDSLLQSVFLDMFGDPVSNPKGWKTIPLGATSIKFSDGPFGSNLKSEHYTENGVRVVRLQNIGVGKFLDRDKVFISEEHFKSLPNQCVSGDVLIGTMGEPNLRACLLPKEIDKALNKADCVLLRPNPKIANAEYLCWLLNMPSTLHMASDLILGQTRSRISMGRLRGLHVPLPPLEQQEQFAVSLEKIEQLRENQKIAAQQNETLFQSLQQRAFAGELFRAESEEVDLLKTTVL